MRCLASLARSVRPVPMKIIVITKAKSKGAQLMAEEWATKLKRFTEVTEVSLKPNPLNAKDNDVAKSQEGERLLKSLSPGEKLILLDERGRDVSSEEIAKLLARASDDSWTKMAFAIGGPYGHSEEVRQKADDVLKLSSCVLNHSVAHVVLLEQLYRAHSMLRGEPYHHV